MGKTRKLISERVDLELSIEDENINAELMDQPLLYRKYSRMEAEAAAAVKAIQLKLKNTRANIHLEHSKGGAKLKVKDLESIVDTNEEVIKIENELIEAEEMHSNLKGILVAFRQRHEALKEVSTNLRNEFKD